MHRILLTDAPAVLGWEEWCAVDEDHVLGEYSAFLVRLIDVGVLRPMPVEALAISYRVHPMRLRSGSSDR